MASRNPDGVAAGAGPGTLVGGAAAAGAGGVPPVGTRAVGPCGLGARCTAPDQELADQYKCRFCGRQLHGFISGCSVARNPRDFRDGVVCKDQPCGPASTYAAAPPGGAPHGVTGGAGRGTSKADGVVRLLLFWCPSDPLSVHY
jgi:hypothetical protein